MIRFPHEVAGWLSEAEGHALAVFASGKRVLEIGCFQGRSTICLAQTARQVVCIDPLDGRATGREEPCADALRENLRRYGLANVEVQCGTTAQIAPRLRGPFDLAFIDGAHDPASVRQDTRWARSLLAEGGLLAYHDYRHGLPQQGLDFGVEATVQSLLAEGGIAVARIDSLILVLPPRDSCRPRRIVLAMPHNGTALVGAARAFFQQPVLRSEQYELAHLDMACSVLELNFNRLWAEARNLLAAGFTHFVMLHDDICPEAGFVEILYEEIERLAADVVSCVVPLKSLHGLTSTALGHDGTSRSIWRPLRRLTMHEVYQLPETFCRQDVALPGPPTLLINTGCWIADLRRDWVRHNVFRNVSRMVAFQDRVKADCMSEDWAFSCDLSRWRASVWATRRVGLYHERPEFHNRCPWGVWQTDEEYLLRTSRLTPDSASGAAPEIPMSPPAEASRDA